MRSPLTAQKLFEVLQAIPESERQALKVVVSDVNDERCDIMDYFVCISRIILLIDRGLLDRKDVI